MVDALEYPWQTFWADAASRVLHLDADHVGGGVRSNLDGDPTALWSEFDGIIEQMDQ